MATSDTARKPLTLPRLQEMRARGERMAMLTCYDAAFAAVLDDCGVDLLLVGDSLGMVLQGHATTLPVTLDQMIYHVGCVARGNRTAWVVADAPWSSYQASPVQAYEAAARLLAAGAQMVKLEGGGWLAPTVEFLVERGIPVCGHLGLTPQSVHHLGGYRVQGRSEQAAERLIDDARALEKAGADLLVLELVPAVLAKTVTEALRIPTIGIGAGPDTSGQVLVLHDMLGLTPHRQLRFVRDFLAGQTSIAAAIRSYVAAVRDGSFPAAEHSY
jgi:3-methyl-2-oxobutanoate hydroxymethyltransferase